MFRVAVLAALAALAALALLVPAGAASAAFPGRDGAIAFASANESGEDCPPGPDDGVFSPCSYVIFSVAPSGKAQRRLSSCGHRANPACNDVAPDWSPGGTTVVFARAGELWTVRADGSDERRLGIDGTQPAWSPDGRRLVFMRRGKVTVANRDGTGLRSLTARGDYTAGGSFQDPAWSSKNLIAYARLSASGADLYTVRPDGTGRRRLLRDCACNFPDFSPNGREILYTAAGKRQTLRSVPVGGGRSRQILAGAADGVWSPSGRFIAYQRGRDIWVAGSDGSKPHRVQYDAQRRLGDDIGGDYSEPSWQPLRR